MLAAAALAVSGCQSDGAGDADDLDLDDVTGSQTDEESSDVAAEPEVESEDTNELDEDTELEVDAETDFEPETESEEDPFAIPDEIDTEYVSRVVNELYRLSFETVATTRDELAPGETLPPDLFDQLRDVYAGERLSLIAIDLQKAVDDGFPSPDMNESPLSWAAQRILVGSPECIIAVGALLLSDESRSDEPNRIPDYFFQLVRGDESDRNATHWRINLDGVDTDPQAENYPGMCS